MIEEALGILVGISGVFLSVGVVVVALFFSRWLSMGIKSDGVALPNFHNPVDRGHYESGIAKTFEGTRLRLDSDA